MADAAFKPDNIAEAAAERICRKTGYGSPLVLIALAGLLLQQKKAIELKENEATQNPKN